MGAFDPNAREPAYYHPVLKAYDDDRVGTVAKAFCFYRVTHAPTLLESVLYEQLTHDLDFDRDVLTKPSLVRAALVWVRHLFKYEQEYENWTLDVISLLEEQLKETKAD